MNKRHVFYVGLVLLAAMVLFGAPMVASAVHPDVPTLKADGTNAAATDAYSPKQTCGGCHFVCSSGTYTTDKASYCATDAARLARFGVASHVTGTNCNTPGMCSDYESMDTTTVSKVQSIPNGTGLSPVTYSVVVPRHGVATGKHSTMGRNDNTTAAMKTIWGAPGTASSPGMWGRF